MKSEIVREEYRNNVSTLDVGDSKGRRQTKIEARTKTPAVAYKPYDAIQEFIKK
ncbi:hypothetical protein I6I99_15520 [Sphingobacterium multivorum]|nr:hypothetical protein [Sphingobacterium multivorum]QQT28769.1 hypothetical protein I6I99_15520 [Sphingobacterium multivorum]